MMLQMHQRTSFVSLRYEVWLVVLIPVGRAWFGRGMKLGLLHGQ